MPVRLTNLSSQRPASQQPLTFQCLSDIREQPDMSKLQLHAHALQARTAAHIPLLKPAETWARKTIVQLPSAAKGGHHGALLARAQVAEVLRQREISVPSDVSLTSSSLSKVWIADPKEGRKGRYNAPKQWPVSHANPYAPLGPNRVISHIGTPRPHNAPPGGACRR